MKRKIKIWPMYHPAASLHQPRLLAIMLNDWEHLPTQVDHSFIVRPAMPITCPTGTLSLDTENDPAGKLGEWAIATRPNPDASIEVVSFNGRDATRLDWGRADYVVFHNAKWDLRVMKRNGLPLPPKEKVVDTMVAAYCLGMGRQDTKDGQRSGDQMVGGLGLKYLARRHLGMEMKTWNEVKDHPEWKQEYNADDSVATLLLWEQFKPKLPEHFWWIDMPLLDVLMTMEDRGILVDPNFLREYANSLDKQLKEIDLNGINPFSHKQVADYVYGTLGIEPKKFTESKQPSVDKEVLELIDDPIVKRILNYRELYKEKTTYATSYLDKMDLDNRLHCEFKQTSTATSRLSSANPNLQNVTRDTELRSLFVAPPGFVMIRLDFWQVELVMSAILAKDERMLSAFAEGRKIHKETADSLGLTYDEGKRINFVMQNGGTAWRFSQEFGVPIDKAKQFIAQYYKTYPGLKKFKESLVQLAHDHKKTVLWTGRTRRLDGMFSGNWKEIQDTEREAETNPPQGGAAEVVKLAMIDLHYKHNAPMLIQVHDELLFEVPEKEGKDYAEWLFNYVPTITPIDGYEFPVEVGLGKNWKESKENTLFVPNKLVRR